MRDTVDSADTFKAVLKIIAAGMTKPLRSPGAETTRNWITQAEARELLKAAWPNKPKYPSEPACYRIAMAINTIGAMGLKAPKQEDVLGTARASAKKFLKSLPAVREEVERRTGGHTTDTLPKISGLTNPPLLEARKWIDEAEKAVNALFVACEPIPWIEPEVFIAREVVAAWQKVDDPPALSPKSDGLLVSFIVLVMSSLGAHRSPASVSEVLRGRNVGRERRGGRKNV